MKSMKSMKRVIFILASTFLMSLVLAAPGRAQLGVVCVNCSEMWTQQMERVTSLEQLKNVLGTYHEAIMQTQQQIELVRNNIQQYQNMIQNTLNLPANLLGQLKGEFNRLAQLTNQLKALKGDVLAMGQVFEKAYPGLDMLKNMAGGGGDLNINELWDNWSKEIDRAAQATFQLTGSQLQDMADNSAALDQHIASLLSTPEGQMQAIQSGNSLAAVQINELRQLRALMAVSIQSATQMDMKKEKEEEVSREVWGAIFKADDFSDGGE
ncbi:MAG: P-type conjugative transfer protein TrbJ [Candidatus Adiutrix sp.]|jgi:P-type conjugative transfer protein TrbJ|nr:P-type conjugative transfer protein TrbJ [Candidatus Adiutrix sp.]